MIYVWVILYRWKAVTDNKAYSNHKPHGWVFRYNIILQCSSLSGSQLFRLLIMQVSFLGVFKLNINAEESTIDTGDIATYTTLYLCTIQYKNDYNNDIK